MQRQWLNDSTGRLHVLPGVGARRSVPVLFGNSATDPAFGTFVVNNYVGGNLICVANDPTAVIFGNIVTGHEQAVD